MRTGIGTIQLFGYKRDQGHQAGIKDITWTLGVVLFNSLVTAPSHTRAPPRALHSVWEIRQFIQVYFKKIFKFNQSF